MSWLNKNITSFVSQGLEQVNKIKADVEKQFDEAVGNPTFQESIATAETAGSESLSQITKSATCDLEKESKIEEETEGDGWEDEDIDLENTEWDEEIEDHELESKVESKIASIETSNNTKDQSTSLEIETCINSVREEENERKLEEKTELMEEKAEEFPPEMVEEKPIEPDTSIESPQMITEAKEYISETSIDSPKINAEEKENVPEINVEFGKVVTDCEEEKQVSESTEKEVGNETNEDTINAEPIPDKIIPMDHTVLEEKNRQLENASKTISKLHTELEEALDKFHVEKVVIDMYIAILIKLQAT